MKTIIIIPICLLFSFLGYAQMLPPFKLLRYEEDYSFLGNDSTRNWYQATKFKSLSKNNKTFLSIGGDIRYQYQWFRHENWGESPADNDGFILTRYLTHADLHAGPHFRTFVQLQSSLANGMINPPSPVDENQLDLHQAFADFSLSPFTVRVGRQELLYGSQRLVAVRDGPNNRQSFDAAKLVYTRNNWKADFFFSYYVRSKPKIFDDGLNKTTKFWGGYLVKNKLPFFKNVDIYYFGLWKSMASFDDGKGKELRHSMGSRIWDNAGSFRYDIEGLYQFGDFEDKQINAWTFSVNAGYTITQRRLKPEIGLKTELISGDSKNNDNKLQTFNPLFPRGGYFGLVSLIGPANLFDIHPSLSLDLSGKLFFDMDYDIFWRYSINDGIYGPNVALIYSGKNSSHRSIGRQCSAHLEYIPNNFLYLRSEFTWFQAAGYLKDVGSGKDILFTAVTAQLKF